MGGNIELGVSKQSGKQPIFVVGVPRSGTTLLAAMLAANSQLSCGPETRFFRFLAKRDPNQLFASWPHEAINFLFNIRLVKPVPVHYGLTRDQLHSYLFDKVPSIPVILSSLTEQFMKEHEKSCWVEKSPEHLMYIHNIREYFPLSPIVRIVRDPRDAAISMTKTTWGPQEFLESLFLYRTYEEQSSAFFEKDDNCYTLFYEDLVMSPEQQLRKLCKFIDIQYEPKMLDTSKSASMLIVESETHKHRVFQQLDHTRIYVWKQELKHGQNRLAEALIGDSLTAYGYECDELFDRFASVFPSLDALLFHKDILQRFVDDGVQFWGNTTENGKKLMVYVGEPDQDRWIRFGKPARWWDIITLAFLILEIRLLHQRIYWIQCQGHAGKIGRSSRLIGFLLQRIGGCQIIMGTV